MTAKEIREISMKNLNKNISKDEAYKNVCETIRNASKAGEFQIYIDSAFTSSFKSIMLKLENSGFKVTHKFGTKYVISWYPAKSYINRV